MILKSEKSIKEYLKKLPDDTIIKYYLDVEYSPFPILVIEEYTRRFKKKTKDEIIKDLKYQGKLARKKTQELGKMAKSHKLVDDVTKQKSDEIIRHAKKKGYEISQAISKKSTNLTTKLKKSAKSGTVKKEISKRLTTSTQKHLDELEKLGKLKKQGLITAKEFQETKKKILSKI
ncbi:Short domain protein [Marine Group I thaumarchaeote SCGC RSA3]|uniref:Short domain protein n=2 Tax=Marine Group I TaxID=905826 RepID=A0A081RPS4_9ARCH|nr:Short domain protein [Marine Group I thaumarchaeote SCGC AAA799-N04]KFM17651.1 Short domain protein [Marine Group I thaumarchaeote SCGC RSA3]